MSLDKRPPEFVPASRDDFWGDNVVMKEKTAAYARAVDRIASGGMVKNNTGTRHPWQDTPRGNTPQAWIQVISGHDEVCPLEQHEYPNIKDLFYHFNERAPPLSSSPSPPQEDQPKPYRRLIFMEDIDPRFAELLGVELSIPPEFFLSHCDEGSHLSVIDSTYAKQGHSRYWRVPLQLDRSIPEGITDFGEYMIECGGCDRASAIISAETTWTGITNMISFWGTEHEDGGWTAVILVDPKTTYLRKLIDPTQPLPDFVNRYALVTTSLQRTHFFTEVRIDAKIPDDNWKLHHERDAFQSLIHAYFDRAETVVHKDDVFSASMILRNFIFSMWDDRIHRFVFDCRHEIESDEFEYREFDTRKAVERLENRLNPDERKFQEIILRGQAIREYRRRLIGIKNAFLAPASPSSFSYGNSLAKNDDYLLESSRWRMLDERLIEIEESFKIYMTSFATRAEMQRSFAANRQARATTQLAKLATVAVPSTLVSGIFSMSGDFAAGERRFGTYWALSLPITVFLLLWVIFADEVGAGWEWIKMRVRGPRNA